MTLEARGLAFGFAGRRVGLVPELTLRSGEVTCVLGPNGAGKTTLFRTLLGLIPALGGSVTLDGRELAAMDRAEVARRVAFVPQAAPLVFEFTLQEMVEMGRVAHLAAFARPSRRDTEVAHEALERLGLAALAQRSFGEVSGGERQLALVARALATGAPHIVMDEPAAHLDFANQSRLLDELARLREAGIAILLCSHDPDHGLRIADRALLLDHGKPLAYGEAAATLTAANLTRLYGVGVTVSDVATASGVRRVCVPTAGAGSR
jgi:iron complex transport system ATP-binding protein